MLLFYCSHCATTIAAVVLIGFVQGYVLLPFGLAAFLGGVFLTALVSLALCAEVATLKRSMAARDVTLFTLPRICLNTPPENNFLPLFLGYCVSFWIC